MVPVCKFNLVTSLSCPYAIVYITKIYLVLRFSPVATKVPFGDTSLAKNYKKVKSINRMYLINVIPLESL